MLYEHLTCSKNIPYYSFNWHSQQLIKKSGCVDGGMGGGTQEMSKCSAYFSACAGWRGHQNSNKCLKNSIFLLSNDD